MRDENRFDQRAAVGQDQQTLPEGHTWGVLPSSATLREHPEVGEAHLPVPPAAFSILPPGARPVGETGRGWPSQGAGTATDPTLVPPMLPTRPATVEVPVAGSAPVTVAAFSPAGTAAPYDALPASAPPAPYGAHAAGQGSSTALVALPQQSVAPLEAPAAENVSAVLGADGAAWLRELRPRYAALRAQRALSVPVPHLAQVALRHLLQTETGSAAQAIRQGLGTLLSATQLPSELAIERVLAARPRHGNRLASEHGLLEVLQQLTRPATLIAEALDVCNQDRRQAHQDLMPEAFLPLAVAYLAGWGVLEHLRTPDVTDVIITPRNTVVARQGRLEQVGPGWDGEAIAVYVEQMGGPKPNPTHSAVDWRLPDGSRGNATHPSTGEGTLCLRQHPEISLTAQDLLASGTLTEQTARFLQAAIEARLNLIIAGGTGSGKTTLLKVCLDLIPRGERPIIIEQEFFELPEPADCISFSRYHSGRPTPDHPEFLTMEQLVTNALRQRPDRIFIGECRGAEVLAMLAAANTGHEGTLTTLHANSAAEAIARLVTLAQGANPLLPTDQLQSKIATIFQLIFFLERTSQGAYGLQEILSLAPSAEPGRPYTTTPLFHRAQVEGRWVCQRTTALLDQRLAERFDAKGISLDWLEGGRHAAS